MENKKQKKGILVALIILTYSLVSVTYTLIIDGKINWSPLFLASCMLVILIRVKSNFNSALKNK